jgi:hypothetical protein
MVVGESKHSIHVGVHQDSRRIREANPHVTEGLNLSIFVRIVSDKATSQEEYCHPANDATDFSFSEI